MKGNVLAGRALTTRRRKPFAEREPPARASVALPAISASVLARCCGSLAKQFRQALEMPGLIGPPPPPNYAHIEARDLEDVAQKLKARAMELGIWDRIVKEVFGLKPKRGKVGMPPKTHLKKTAENEELIRKHSKALKQQTPKMKKKKIAEHLKGILGFQSTAAVLRRMQRIEKQEADKRSLERADSHHRDRSPRK